MDPLSSSDHHQAHFHDYHSTGHTHGHGAADTAHSAHHANINTGTLGDSDDAFSSPQPTRSTATAAAGGNGKKLLLLGGTDQDVQRKLQQQKQLYGIGASFDESMQSRVSKKAALQVNHQVNAAALPQMGSEKSALLGQEAPVDKYNIAYLICFLQGVGMLFPWNAFITAQDYFSDRFNGTSYESSYSNYFTFTFQGVNIFCFALSLRFQHLFSLRVRILIPLFLQFTAFFLTTVMVKVDSVSVDGFFLFTMFTVIICGGCTAFYQGAMFGVAGALPAKFMQSLMSGQALGGVIVSIASVLSLVGTDDAQVSAIAYFCVSVAVILACIITYFVLVKLPIIVFYSNLSNESKNSQVEARMGGKEITPILSLAKPDPEATPVSPAKSYGALGKASETSSASLYGDLANTIKEDNEDDDDVDLDDSSSDKAALLGKPGTPRKPPATRPTLPSRSPSAISTRSDSVLDVSMLSSASTSASGTAGIRSFSFLRVWRRIRWLAFLVGYNFFVTLAMFPSITGSVNSLNASSEPDNKFYNKLFVPIYCFLLFNIGDYLGRVIAGWVQFPKHGKVWIPILLRTAFIPLFMLCNVKDTTLPVVFSSDAWPFIFMLLFASTNGYLGSLCMMYGPGLVDMHEKEVAGTMMAFMLSLGLSLGSLSSFGFKAIVTNKSPF